MLTSAEERNLLEMVQAIYHHLGLDGKQPVSILSVREQAQKDVLKFVVF